MAIIPFPNQPNTIHEKNHPQPRYQPRLKSVEKGFHLISGNWQEKVAALRAAGGKDIWFFGGSNLLTHFMNSGLIDELQLSLHPVVLGGGTPLFQDIAARNWFDLASVQQYDSGLVQLIYRRR